MRWKGTRPLPPHPGPWPKETRNCQGCARSKLSGIPPAAQPLLRRLCDQVESHRHGPGLLHLPGGGGNDTGNAIALDSSGNAYVTGGTGSADFPTTPGAFQMTYGGGICGVPPNALPFPDSFVTRLNPPGTAPPVYSTYLGGSSFFDVGIGIAVDPGCGP